MFSDEKLIASTDALHLLVNNVLTHHCQPIQNHVSIRQIPKLREGYYILVVRDDFVAREKLCLV